MSKILVVKGDVDNAIVDMSMLAAWGTVNCTEYYLVWFMFSGGAEVESGKLTHDEVVDIMNRIKEYKEASLNL